MQPLGIGLDWVTKVDIDGHGLEAPAGQLTVDLVTHGTPSQTSSRRSVFVGLRTRSRRDRQPAS
jgi:hypothetical protein